MENTQTPPSDTPVPVEIAPPQTQNTIPPEPPVEKKHTSVRTIVVWLFALLGVFFMIAVVGYVLYTQFYKPVPSQTPQQEQPATPQQPESSAQPESNGISEENEDISATDTPKSEVLGSASWLSPVQKVSALPIFTEVAKTAADDGGYFRINEAKYYKVGTLEKTGDLYRIAVPVNAPSQGTSIIVLKTSNAYSILDDTNDTWMRDELMKSLLSSVSYRYATVADRITPEKIKIAEGELTRMFEQYPDLDGVQSTEGMPTTPYGKLIRTYNTSDDFPGVSYRALFLHNNDGTYSYYELENPILTDDKKLATTFTGAVDTEHAYAQGFAGCGMGFGGTGVPVIPEENGIDDAEKIGESKYGPVYQITDADSKVLKSLYHNYTVGRATEDTPAPLSLSEFAKTKNHFLWKDNLGDWQIFMNQEYAPIAECGKPVVYLYPKSPTDVAVQVGAQVTVSDPEYGNGWNGRAFPDGKIIVNGKTYPYLFWEGTGNGSYPSNIASRGSVVKRNDALSTIQTQLYAQGLNEKEVADFVEFWGPKIPTTPYVRLSWLGTREMDELAPLSIAPKADTTIRVFLDMQGLESSKSITPQRFFAPERKGFTVVEWGGLLLGNMK